MILSEKIKLETFCAFIHSRFTGIGVSDADDDIVVFKDENCIPMLNEKGNPIIKYLSEIGTLESINKKISGSQSIFISNMYHDYYSMLLKLMEDKIKNGDDVIMSLIGVGLLISYVDNDKYEKTLNISLDDLNFILTTYERKSEEHRSMITKMMRVSTYIVENYWKEIKIKKHTKNKKKERRIA